MSSTTGAVLILVAGLGSMGYMTYRAVMVGDNSTREVKEMLDRDESPVHVRFVTHETPADMMRVLAQLRVQYRRNSKAVKIVFDKTMCEIHVLVRPTDPKLTDEFIGEQVTICREMAGRFKGKEVVY